jgi:hypothetical protein
VEWEGYGPGERSWESTENVQNAAETVAEFHQCYPNRPVVSDLPGAASQSPSDRRTRSTRSQAKPPESMMGNGINRSCSHPSVIRQNLSGARS